MKLIVPSEACASTEPQTVGPYGTFPIPLDESGMTVEEVQALIDAGVPLRIVDATKKTKAAAKAEKEVD